MKLVTTMPERGGAVRIPRGMDLLRCWGVRASIVDLHARLAPELRRRGYQRGLFRGSCRCPVKTGALRFYWMEGFREGFERRMAAKSKRSRP